MHRNSVVFYFRPISPWSEQTVSNVLQFFQELYSRTRERLAELTGVLRLEQLLKARLGTLSKGERKRVMLGLGLLTPQPLLLLDEPFDGLDLRQTREVMSLLAKRPRRAEP